MKKQDNASLAILNKKVQAWMECWKNLEEDAFKVCFGLLCLVNEFGRVPVYKIIIKAHPTRFNDEKLDYLCNCGSRQFPPQYLLDDSPGAKLMRSLGYSLAEGYLTEDIAVVTEDSKSSYQMKYVPYSKLTTAECHQVKPATGSEKLKNKEEQIVYLQEKESRYVRPVQVVPITPFFVRATKKGFHVVLRRSVDLTRDEILPLANKMLQALETAATGDALA